MYSFAQREDTAVVDEPLYGHYLKTTLAPQPHRDELLKILETDADKIVAEKILKSPQGKEVYFVKNMAHHLIDMNLEWLSDTRITNAFLIRDPVQMLPSLINQIEKPTMRDTAYASQAKWFTTLCEAGHTPAVIDSRDLLLDPERILTGLCDSLGMAFDASMLSWEAGPREEDGAWATYWYHNVHRSTGFAPFREKTEPFPEFLKPLLEECLPHYEMMAKHRIL